jgi:hypothetical protein
MRAAEGPELADEILAVLAEVGVGQRRRGRRSLTARAGDER